MSFNRTGLEILEGGLEQALRLSAPLEMTMRLRGAIAFASQSGEPRIKPQDVIELTPTDAAPVEVE